MIPTPTRDPYDTSPPFWLRHEDAIWAWSVGLLTVFLTVISFPPFKAGDAAYAFASPAILWAYRRPRFKLFAWTMAAAQAAAWAILLFWLRHVTWAGPIVLGPFVGVWVGVWYLAVWWAMPRMIGRPSPVRLAAQLGLAGVWVLVEWTRTWLFSGFPWLPLAASQWRQTSVLQVAAYTGAYGVSFVLIAVNIGFAAYFHRLFFEGRRGLSKRSQEFFLALFLLLVCLAIQVQDVMNRRYFDENVGRVAFVQPYTPATLKWDPAEGPAIFQTLYSLTLDAAAGRPDVILWPEAALPWPVLGDPDPAAKSFVETLAKEAKAPLLIGALSWRDEAGKTIGSNGAVVVNPDSGLQKGFYSKRHLVPFGEYVPLRSLPIFRQLSKFVPIDVDFTPGTSASPLVVGMPDGAQAFGPLICYEDVFPSLSRASVLEGADILVVLTNDAWYGEEGEAAQHAAHSVLRAVETRRPVLRCGNGGWSGWIDEYGVIRKELTNKKGSVYFRGDGFADVTHDSRWVDRDSFYVRHGDWFVLACAAAALFAWLLLRTGVPSAPPPEP